jgi:hypothetical protein
MTKKDLNYIFAVLCKIKNPDQYVATAKHIIDTELKRLEARGKALKVMNDYEI